MKKTVYISLFTLLGVFLSFLVHAAIEIPMTYLLAKNFERYSLGLSWHQWFLVHHVGTAVLLILGIAFGFGQGRYWWQRIYSEKI